MSRTIPSYPAEVWDGTSESRASRYCDSEPDFRDYDQASAELIAAQNEAATVLDDLVTRDEGPFDQSDLANVANGGEGIPVVFRITIGAMEGNTDVVLTNKTKILNAWFVKTTAAGNNDSETLTLKNGTTNAISNAMVINIADKAIVRIGTIDDAFDTVSAGGTLRATTADASNMGQFQGILYVLGLQVA